MDLFNECEMFFQRCDAESRELILVGDLNCDVSKASLDPHTPQLSLLCSLYQIDQLTDKPTRVTDPSGTMMDLVLKNVKENIHASGVIHLGISDHSLIYAVMKFMLPKTNPGVREIRDYKQFDAELFVEDLSRIPWNAIQQFNNPNTCWNVWKSVFTETLNRHAPIRHKRTKRNSVPWITPRINEPMRNRDYHKKRAIKFASKTHWESFKKLRNEVNIQMRNAKSKFFHDKINDCSRSNDPKEAWTLINTLLGKNNKPNNLSELSVNDNLVSDPKSMAEALNDYFFNIRFPSKILHGNGSPPR